MFRRGRRPACVARDTGDDHLHPAGRSRRRRHVRDRHRPFRTPPRSVPRRNVARERQPGLGARRHQHRASGDMARPTHRHHWMGSLRRTRASMRSRTTSQGGSTFRSLSLRSDDERGIRCRHGARARCQERLDTRRAGTVPGRPTGSSADDRPRDRMERPPNGRHHRRGSSGATGCRIRHVERHGAPSDAEHRNDVPRRRRRRAERRR